MKLLEQTILHFQQGSSDKVYEVDLCEMGAGQFVVNFRYGRRDANLKEGTKTVFPVDRETAQTTYEKLINSKVKKGYFRLGETPTSEQSSDSDLNEVRATTIQHRLETLIQTGEWNDNWKLGKVIWRVGGLKLTSVIPTVLELINGNHWTKIAPCVKGEAELFWYAVVWTFGRCQTQEALPFLQRLMDDASQSALIHRIATASFLHIADEPAQQTVTHQLTDTLPENLKKALSTNQLTNTIATLNECLFDPSIADKQFLSTVYLISSTQSTTYKALLSVLHKVPLKPNYFKFIRQIFKLAELREDHQMYALLAHQFEKRSSHFHHDGYGVYLDSGWVNDISKELSKPTSRLAYSNKTRAYFRRRVLRDIQKLGEANQASYAKVATQLLLQFSPNDATGITETSQYYWSNQGYNIVTTYYDAFASYPYLNFILYTNSSRYAPTHSGRWACQTNYQPGQPAPENREEAYPHLWNAYPEGLVEILTKSQVAEIQYFALKALQANPAVEQLINTEILIQLFASTSPQVLAFAFRLAKQRYDEQPPATELILAMTNSESVEAQDFAIACMATQQGALLQDATLTSQLLFCSHERVQAWMKNTLPLVPFTSVASTSIIHAVIQRLITQSEENLDETLIASITTICLASFEETLRVVPFGTIERLLASPFFEVQAFAARILAKHETPAEALPEAIFQQLLKAESPSVRTAGIALFAQLPEEILLQRRAVLVNFLISEMPEAREAARPIIAKLANQNDNFAHEIIELLVPLLLEKESQEGLHDSIFSLLVSEIPQQLSHINLKGFWKLAKSRETKANELAWQLTQLHINLKELSVRELVTLGSNELLPFRKAVWQIYSDEVARMKYEREESIRLLDAKWEDTRAFAVDYFKTQFTHEDWTPELLVSICDSILDDVQTFGYNLITQFFEEKDGPSYLLKLSQHPTSKLQLYATNYLERFATDQPERIEQLMPYFTTVLSQVNKARVAKQRVFQFLHQEALKEQQVAKLVAALMNRQAVTVAIGDKAKCITILRDIQEKYPQIGSNLKKKKIQNYQPQ